MINEIYPQAPYSDFSIYCFINYRKKRAYPVEADTYQIWAVSPVAAKIIHYL
jgi:hypothetical protein